MRRKRGSAQPQSRTQLLDAFQAKAGCSHTQRKAESLWELLWPKLTEAERTKLQTAWGHATLEEGRAELDKVCAELRAAWAI